MNKTTKKTQLKAICLLTLSLLFANHALFSAIIKSSNFPNLKSKTVHNSDRQQDVFYGESQVNTTTECPANVFIDSYVEHRLELIRSIPSISDKSTLHVFSHGRPGRLFIEGKWLDGISLTAFFRYKLSLNPSVNHINIYGCEFAKGKKGTTALNNLTRELCVSIAASNNITGTGGDWVLEEGDGSNALAPTHYKGSLQGQCVTKTYNLINTGWTAHSPATGPQSTSPSGCTNNTGGTTHSEYANDKGFETWYDTPSGVTWSRSLNGLDPNKTYRVYANMYATSGSNDKRNSYFNNYNLAGKTGSNTFVGGSDNVNQVIYNFEVTGKTALSFSGTILAAAYSGCEQAKNFHLTINVSEVISTPTYTAPTVSQTQVSNACPANIASLSGIVTSSCGTGTSLEWHTVASNASAANLVPNPAQVSAGTYYAYCYNAASNCYSPASSAVMAAINPCCVVELNGTVYKDTDGTENGINGTVINGTSIGLYVSLTKDNAVLATQPVSAVGTYKFENFTPGVYKLVLGKSPAGASTANLPNNYITVGEGGQLNVNGYASGDDQPNSEISASTDCSGVSTGSNIAVYSHLDFGLKTVSALPVTLISLSAKAQEHENILLWKTSHEVDFERFIVEKACDVKEGFMAIGDIKGGEAGYQFIDKQPLPLNYYRLKMIDLDGSFAYSRIININRQQANDQPYSYPNPVDQDHFFISDKPKIDSFRLLDLDGRTIPVVLTDRENKYLFQMDRKPAPGLYLLELRYNHKVYHRKIVVR